MTTAARRLRRERRSAASMADIGKAPREPAGPVACKPRFEECGGEDSRCRGHGACNCYMSAASNGSRSQAYGEGSVVSDRGTKLESSSQEARNLEIARALISPVRPAIPARLPLNAKTKARQVSP